MTSVNQGPTRAEHMAWCKQRAIEYVEMGDLNGAFASLVSDLGKHPETSTHAALELGMLQLITGHLSTPAEMRSFIEGCN